MLGLSILLAGARRTSRRGSAARRGLKHSRRETATVTQDRDDLIDQRETARASTASTLGNGAAGRTHLTPDDDRDGWLHMFGRRSAPQQTAAPRRRQPRSQNRRAASPSPTSLPAGLRLPASGPGPPGTRGA